jgi:hypothetical protein
VPIHTIVTRSTRDSCDKVWCVIGGGDEGSDTG